MTAALLAALLGCTAVEPAEVRAAVLGGELDAAARLLAEADGAELGELAAVAARWEAVRGEQRALASASRELLREATEARLLAGDLSGAAAPLASALVTWPQDPAFLQLAMDLGTAAEQAPPEAAVPAWQALAELLAADPERARAWAARADRAELAWRYRPEGLAQARAAQRGVTRAAVDDLLALVDREHVTAPDWAQASAAAARRLGWLAEAEGARQAWPALATARFAGGGAGLDGARAALDAALAAAPGVPEEVILAEWVEGALDALDPWSRPVWPAEIAGWEAHHAGVQVGVGVELDDGPDGRVVVARPLPGTPAWEGGIHQGDVLVALADPTGRLDLADLPAPQRRATAEAALVGPPGSALTLELERAGQPLARTLSRAPVVRETVQGWARQDDNAWSAWLDPAPGLAYVRIDAFRDATEPDFDALLDPLLGHIGAVVLDLRGNPGGDVNAAVQVADRFVEEGWLAQVSGRVLPETGPDVDPATGQPLAEWNEALAGHALEGTPVIVLVDGATASAAEVLAGALQERAGAVVVGAPTWGKGYAQKLHTDPAGRWAVQLTNLHWTTPEGRRLVHGVDGGIVPAVALPPASPGEDFQLAWQRAQRAALRVHADGTPMRPVGTPPRQDLPPLSEDPALVAAELVARALLLPPG